MAKRVSSIYGNALFELAVEEKKVDALLSEVQTLQQILLENADLLSLLNHPEVSKIEKLDLLKNIFSDGHRMRCWDSQHYCGEGQTERHSKDF